VLSVTLFTITLLYFHFPISIYYFIQQGLQFKLSLQFYHLRISGDEACVTHEYALLPSGMTPHFQTAIDSTQKPSLLPTSRANRSPPLPGMTTIWVGGVKKTDPVPAFTLTREKFARQWKMEEGEDGSTLWAEMARSAPINGKATEGI
jgi:hypothetical protein